MPVHIYRELKPTPEAEAIYRRWISNLNEEFTRHQSFERRADIVRDELYQMYLSRTHGGRKAVHSNQRTCYECPRGVLRSPKCDTRARVLRRRRYRKVQPPQAAHLVLADVRPLPAGPEPLARLSASRPA